ncbi:MAG: zinc-binding dehydrogenase [Acidobacteria bacterium]|nr:zinc-binding dehydrogenase [Acidobacteriota bacterium]
MKVAACGVCHTDLHYIDHGVKTYKPPPVILGHEPSGHVAGVGAGVKKFKEGDRVLIPPVVTCGACFFCRSGRENICATMLMFGNNLDGAFAEYVAAPAKDCVALPDGLPLEESCIISDAVSTPFHAVVNRAKVRPGESVVVYGCGGVGMNAVQVAAALGASVVAVDINDQKLELARRLGATATLNARTVESPEKAVREITGGGADVALEALGNPATIRAAFQSLRRGGRFCLIGYCPEEVAFQVAKLMYFEMTIVGSLGCRPVDYPPLLELVRLGRIQVLPLVTGRFPLEGVNEALDLLRAGEGLRSIVLPSR